MAFQSKTQIMKSSNHFLNFKHLSEINMSETHTIFWTGMAVGFIMLCMSLYRTGIGGIDKRLIIYGFGCALLMNIPFGLNLYLAGFVPPTELAIIITMSPFFNYLAAVISRNENSSPRKLLAIFLGFLSTLVLILTRQGTLTGSISWPLVFSISTCLVFRFKA